MVDFGARKPERPLAELVTRKLRPGDIYTHMYSGLRGEQDESGKVNPALWEARKRGVLFDVGHRGTSFAWRIAVPAVKEGWLPDVISTDLHVASMSAGMKDMPNVMSKFLALGLPFDEIVRKTTWNAAGAIRQEDLGHLRVGADADVAVWRIERGSFGFVDGPGTVSMARRGRRADAPQWQGCVRSERHIADSMGSVTKNEKRKTRRGGFDEIESP